jgi:hypothetical protein
MCRSARSDNWKNGIIGGLAEEASLLKLACVIIVPAPSIANYGGVGAVDNALTSLRGHDPK